MTTMRYSRFHAYRAMCLVAWFASGCVSDHTVEADVPARPGIVQPDGGGAAKLTAAVACERIKSARASTATKLGCDEPTDECPKYLFVAGTTPCAEYVGGSVAACVAVIERYAACKDFSEKACVVAPVAGTCRPPATPDAGSGTHDSGGARKDAGGAKRDGAKGDGAKRDGAADADKPDG